MKQVCALGILPRGPFPDKNSTFYKQNIDFSPLLLSNALNPPIGNLEVPVQNYNSLDNSS